ncbi:hypothetical protein L2E82_39818 [Cichorium intybus]|uniref:Uncharacterized protein n=1 Tax=Cichorium intybus TaxID=13427 RepID=A0ACB9AJC7_CICIN|nr:hypothetical protein L2E82_39818 [Cichorium intybus]
MGEFTGILHSKKPDNLMDEIPTFVVDLFPSGLDRPDQNEKIIRKYYPKEYGPVTNVDPIGNSPVIIRKDLLEKIALTWMNVSLTMQDDPVTDRTFGWLCVTYAYAMASALHGVHHILRKDSMIQVGFIVAKKLDSPKPVIIFVTGGPWIIG